MTTIRRVLISVYDKRNLVEFSKVLSTLGVEILSTGGTATQLRDAGVKVMDIAEYTGFPEVFEGRLKTLHPKVHGGILYKRDDDKHGDEARANDIGPIDMVIVNLYPFEQVTAKEGCAFADAIENIDIGGPTMVRAAAKNHASVAVMVDPDDYENVAQELIDAQGCLSETTRFRLAKKAFAVTARYDAAIATYLSWLDDETKQRKTTPDTMGYTFSKVMDLRYGENPHQDAAFYRDERVQEGPSLVVAKKLHGKELSYNNIMDADAALAMVEDFLQWPFACVIMKHANPCGVAVSGQSLDDAFKKALACDPLSAFGGIIGVNKPIDETVAMAIAESFFEVIVAPGYSEDACAILTKKKNIRLLHVPGLGMIPSSSEWNLRKVTGGLLVQQRDASSLDISSARVVTKRQPRDDEWEKMRFAWRVVKHVKSNAIVFTREDRTIGIGAGQMSRVDSSRLAVMKAQDALQGTALASDAFFPFRDGVDEAANVGATAIVQPGGSLRDEEVIAAANEHEMAMIFTGERHFRH